MTKEGRVAPPIGTLDPAVEEGREGKGREKGRKGSLVWASRHFFLPRDAL